MLTETHRGRKLCVRKSRDRGTVDGYVNGQLVVSRTSRDQEQVLAQFRIDIDFIDCEPVNGDRWGAYWYAPDTYTICNEGIHPVALDGKCQHFTCRRKRRETMKAGR